jgi:hypothetical protein
VKVKRKTYGILFLHIGIRFSPVFRRLREPAFQPKGVLVGFLNVFKQVDADSYMNDRNCFIGTKVANSVVPGFVE